MTWIIQDPSKIKPLPTTKFDWDKLPAKPFDIGVPDKFTGPIVKRNWIGMPCQVLISIWMPYQLKRLKIKTTVLGEPTIVRQVACSCKFSCAQRGMIGDSEFWVPGVPNNAIKDKDGMIWFGTDQWHSKI